MRVLFLTYSHFKTIDQFVSKSRTGFCWVDSMIDELCEHDNLSLGLAVPLRSGIFAKKTSGNLTLYGLPELISKNKLYRYLLRLRHEQAKTDLLKYSLEAIDDFKPDIIQIFGTENPFGKLSQLTERRVIIHFQGCLRVVLAKWFAGLSFCEQFFYNSFRNHILFRGILHEYFVFRTRAAIEEDIMSNCRFIIGRTAFDKGIVSLLAPKAKYFHGDEFLRHNFFNHCWSHSPGNPIKCVSVLKGVSYKGLDLLFGLSAVIEKFTKTDVRFRICGIQEDEEIVSMLKYKHRKGTDFSKFTFEGKLDTNSLIDKMLDSNLFIHPSYVENSSNSICEAMALGMPVIATNVGGTSSLIENGVNGILIQEGEPLSMAAAIITLVKDHEYAVQIGKNARATAIKRHDPDTLYRQLIHIYEIVMAE